jgi:hypothetical protein
MTRKEASEYQAKVTNDSGVLRGKIPSPLVRSLGAREGDYIIFRSDGAGNIRVSVSRSKGGGKKGGAKKSVRRGR